MARSAHRFRSSVGPRRVRPRDLALAGALLVALAAAATYLMRAYERLSGGAQVVDGDSLLVAGRSVRLIGIDAPELAQTCQRDGRPWPCGEAARRRLGGLVAGDTLTCMVEDTDRYGRALAVCGTPAEPDLGRRLVREGVAVGFGRYFAEEGEARAARRGLWAGDFEPPADYRARHPRPVP